MEDGNVKPLKPKTKEINKDLNNAYNKDLGGREIPINSPDDKAADEKVEEQKIEENTQEKTKKELREEKKEQKKEAKEQKKEQKKSDKLSDKIQSLEEEVKKYKELAARKTAELDNMLKRTLKEKNELIDYGNAGLFNRLLPLMDDFAKAIEAGQKNTDYNSLLQGIEMIYQKAQKTFEDSGVKKIEVNPGDEFDVEYHEAVMQMPHDEIEEGKVVQVAQEGYMLKERVLRHTKVVTSAGKANS